MPAFLFVFAVVPHARVLGAIAPVRNRGLEHARRECHRRHAQVSSVALPRDGHALRIDVSKILQILHARDHVFQVAAAIVLIVRRLEHLAVARAPAHIRRQHHVAAQREVLHVVIECVEPLHRGAAVRPDQHGAAPFGRSLGWPVEIRIDPGSIEALVNDLFGLDQASGGARELRVRQLARRAIVHVYSPKVQRSRGRLVEICDPRALCAGLNRMQAATLAARTRPSLARRACGARRRPMPRCAARRCHSDSSSTPRSGHRGPVRFALVGRFGRQRLRLAARQRYVPVIQPAAAMRAEEQRLPVGRDERVPKCLAIVIIEQVEVARNEAFSSAARGWNRAHVVVFPPLVEPDEDDFAPIGGKYGVHFVEWAARQARGAAIRHLGTVDIEPTVTIARQRERSAVGRP